VPGVLGNEASAGDESHESGLLEAPHWTRPAQFRGWEVPGILLSGHHAAIQRWRREASLDLTARSRPDLIERALSEGRVEEAELRQFAPNRSERVIMNEDAAPTGRSVRLAADTLRREAR
jgi:tRNA (guanine37-N1)-methyltransferase